MQRLNVKKVDEIFQKFQKTFDVFYVCQCDMQTAVEKFETAFNSAEDFQACLDQFHDQLKGERVGISGLVPKFPKAVKTGDKLVSDAAEALTSICKAYEDLEKLPVKVIKKGTECLRDAMSLNLNEIAGERIGGSGYDFGKSPEQVKSMRTNLKEIKRVPKIVEDFFEYASSIVLLVMQKLVKDPRKEESVREKKTRVVADLKKEIENFWKVAEPAPPKEINFTLLGIPDVDRLFDDVAKLVNPIVRLSNDMFNARNRIEQVAKAVSQFRDDPSKAFHDYLEELKKRLKEGKRRPLSYSWG